MISVVRRRPAWPELLRALALVVAVASAAPAGAHQASGSRAGTSVAVETVPVTFEPSDPERVLFGKLAWRGGFEILSDDERFGGLSGAVVSEDGATLVAVSDLGRWLTGRLLYGGDGRLTGIADVAMAPLLDTAGRPIRRKRNQDAEALAHDRDGALMVGFERTPRLLSYPFAREGVAARPTRLALPRAVADGPNNKELEAVDRFPAAGPLAGAILAVSERKLDAEGNITGWLVGGPRPGAFSIARRGSYDVTDVAILPSGEEWLTLERRFSPLTGVGMAVRRFRAADLVPGATLSGELLFDASQRYSIDNMEALALHRTAEGELRLTIVSDDNFNGFQRTLVLQFALPDRRLQQGAAKK